MTSTHKIELAIETTIWLRKQERLSPIYTPGDVNGALITAGYHAAHSGRSHYVVGNVVTLERPAGDMVIVTPELEVFVAAPLTESTREC